mgnify:CR=1 FL=1
MGSVENYKLSEIIDVISLKDIQDKFAKMVGLSTVTVENSGNPLVAPSNFTEFCSLIRSSNEGNNRCIKCDSIAGTIAMESGKPVVYNCHSGLIDVAAPIIVNDHYLGCMLCGQVLINDVKGKNFIDTVKLSKELDIDENLLIDAVKKIPVVEYEKIKDASEFLFLFSNLIAKMGIVNITQSELMEEIKEKMKLERLLKNIELKALQSQVNPHFLFNTLNVIARMALIEDSPTTEELIYALSDILRYSLKNADKMVDINAEMSNTDKYLYLQKIRKGDRIKFEFDISPEILSYNIPVMTLQPLIENSILHGFKNKSEDGFLKISGFKNDEKSIIIKISDNGAGMNKETLDKILDENRRDTIGLGVNNVNSRLKHVFGDEYGLSIESEVNKGTCVSIKIPTVKLSEGGM